VLELKTKTVSIDRLKDLDHAGHTIVSWSLNAPSISARDEGRSASLDQRINAALKCLDWGYFLGFHFDPLFFFPGWEDEYDFTVKKLFENIPPDRIVYISLGAFRFMPELKVKILSKRPKWKLVSGEFVLSPDGKKRYFVDIRVSLYRFMLDRIRSFAPDVCVYLCMESGSVWKRVFEFSPDEKGGLPAILDDAVKKTMKVGTNCSRSAASLFLKKPQPV
jgi:spore photoproduct lyase